MNKTVLVLIVAAILCGCATKSMEERGMDDNDARRVAAAVVGFTFLDWLFSDTEKDNE